MSGLTLAAAIAERSHLIREQARREGVAESERTARRIVETANDGIWMLDDRLATIFANQRLASLLGYTVSEMLGRSLFDFVFEQDSRQKVADLRQLPEPVGEQLQGRYRKKDGSELWTLVSRTPTFDDDGRFTGVLKMVSDVTEHRRVEQERQRARETVLLLSEAVDQTADSVIVTDRSGRIEYMNPAFESTTGYTRAEALGSTPRLLKSGQHDEAYYKGMWAVLLGGHPFRGTLVNSRKNGEHYWAEQTITPMKDARGTITHFVSVLKDVTVARRHQEQQTQLRLAREVQQRFYTATLRVPGFDIAASAYPAEQTGGDYFDLIMAGDGRLPCDRGRERTWSRRCAHHGHDTRLRAIVRGARVGRRRDSRSGQPGSPRRPTGEPLRHLAAGARRPAPQDAGVRERRPPAWFPAGPRRRHRSGTRQHGRAAWFVCRIRVSSPYVPAPRWTHARAVHRRRQRDLGG